MIEKVGEDLPLAKLLYLPPSVNTEVMNSMTKPTELKESFWN